MSVGYSVLAVALGASEAHNGLGTITGRITAPIDKVFGVFNALGERTAQGAWWAAGCGGACMRSRAAAWKPCPRRARRCAPRTLHPRPLQPVRLAPPSHALTTPSARACAGNIAFAFNSAIVLMEIQDTLREPPRAETSMKKALRLG